MISRLKAFITNTRALAITWFRWETDEQAKAVPWWPAQPSASFPLNEKCAKRALVFSFLCDASRSMPLAEAQTYKEIDFHETPLTPFAHWLDTMHSSGSISSNSTL